LALHSIIAIFVFQGAVDDFTLQIYLGIENNTKSGVRDRYSQPALVEVNTPGVLNCTQPVPVWITWYNRTLRVGRGDLIGYRQLMSCDISSYGDIYNSIGFANTHQAGGHFMIRRNAGQYLIIT
jgi:Farnesoic acid 0-methyl transferase